MRRLIVRAAAVLALMVMWLPTSMAESGELQAIHEEVRALRHAIDRLDKRLEGLERQTPGRPEVAAQPTSAARAEHTSAEGDLHTIKDHWRAIEKGMTSAQVETLLGQAHRTVTMTAKTIWHYTYRDLGSGSVVFVEGTVIDWQVPPFDSWWGM